MKRAFTLVETLTVMMIVLIAAAATYPVFFQAKAKAKQTVCLSNLHQIYLAIKLYESDFDAPPWCASSTAWWVKSYTGGVELQCPSAYRPSDQLHGADYEITAGPIPGTSPATIKANSYLKACHEVRSGEFVDAFDLNHGKATDAYRGGGARVLLVRDSGQVVTVPAPVNDPFGFRGPCKWDFLPIWPQLQL